LEIIQLIIHVTRRVQGCDIVAGKYVTVRRIRFRPIN